MGSERDRQSQASAPEGGPITWRLNLKEARDIVQCAVSASPLTHRYGVCIVDQITAYYWCESVPELLELALEAMPVFWAHIDPESLDNARHREIAEDLLGELRKAKDAYEKLAKNGASARGDDLVSFDSPVTDWEGTFDDLCEGVCHRAISERESFWESEAYDHSDATPPPARSDPIPENLRAKFAESLEQLG